MPLKSRFSSTTLSCENIRFSSLFAAGEVSRGETSPAAKSVVRCVADYEERGETDVFAG